MKAYLLKQYAKLDPNLRRLATYLVPYKLLFIGAIVCMGISAGSSSLIALLLGKLTDIGFYQQAPWIIIAAPIGLILISFLHGGGMFMSNYLLSKASQSVLVTLRKELFNDILHWPSEAYQRNSTGIIASKFVNEANVALSNAAKSAIVLIRDSLQVVALSFVLVWHDVMLTLVTLIIAPAIVWLLKFISGKLRSIMASAQENVGTLLVRVKESYEAQDVIKISNSYDEELKRFAGVNEVVKNLALRMTKYSAVGTPATQLIGMLGVAVVLTVALIEAQHGLLTLGEFVTFLAAMLLILQPLRRLTGLNATFVGMAVAAGSIFATLDEAKEHDAGTKELKKDEVKGAMTFDHVTLRYPGANRDSVHDFCLEVHPGDTIALVGSSGSGKTSLVNMIPRFWNPSSGRILIDGIDAQEITLKSLRDNIAIVSQDVVIFDGTIRDNLVYGSPDATEEQIEAAVEAAALKDFIASLPEGLETPVGEYGGKLSGGQKQRISIARALLKNAPILLLDEATSALDSESEHHIKEALIRLMKGRTSFIVAHRLSTIEHATKIVVMADGSIVESGTHRELLDKDGAYANLWRLQGHSE